MSGTEKATVTLSIGELEGVRRDGLCLFKGVPYAAAPVGPRRWMPPQPIEPWQGVYRADKFREIAPQNPMIGGPNPEEPEPQSEDCLFSQYLLPRLGRCPAAGHGLDPWRCVRLRLRFLTHE